MWLAKKLGYSGERGLEVKIQYFPNGGAALASGAAGDWQGGWTGSPPAITGWAKFGLTPVGTMMKEDRNIKLIMRKDALKGSKPAEVLATKPIGTVPNSTWSQVLFACAKHFKVDPGKMKVVPLDPPVTRQSLHSGDVASGTTDSSPDIDLVNDKANFEVVCDGAIAGTSVIDPWMVTKKFAAENPAAAARFVEAGFRANELIMADRERADALPARVLQGRRHRRQRSESALHARLARLPDAGAGARRHALGRQREGTNRDGAGVRRRRRLRQGAGPERRHEGRPADPRGGEEAAQVVDAEGKHASTRHAVRASSARQ